MLRKFWGQRALLSLLVLGTASAHGGNGARPNILFILTDDQDVHMDSLKYMPKLQKHLIQEGTTFDHHYCTVALCCPSRVNLWTGQMPHNTNVTDVKPPYGGYPKFIDQGYNDKHLALWMQQSGYNTYYTGKMFNGHTITNYNSPPLSGYTGSQFFLDPFTYHYYNVTSTHNNEPPVNYAGLYSTDIVRDRTLEFIQEAVDSGKPFFITSAPIAPHSEGNVETQPPTFEPPLIDPRYEGLFKDYKIPRLANFNPQVPSGVGWVSRLPRLNDTTIAWNDEYQRKRLRSLQSVDEMIDRLIKKLEKVGVLSNTYIFYSADNGYHISQHRLSPGKECGFETDINIPLIVSGPGIARGKRVSVPTSHTDLAPTIMKLAGNSYDDLQFDGVPIPLKTSWRTERNEHTSVEFWSSVVPEDAYGRELLASNANVFANNTYKGLRLQSEDYSFYYSVWCTNEKELYDMKRDPSQVHNLLASRQPYNPEHIVLGRPLSQVLSRLDALLMVLKSCKEKTCVDPWRALHPRGNVRSLRQALRHDFDKFYHDQPKVSFSACELGYIVAAEGPQVYNQFGEVPKVLSSHERDL